MMEIKDGQMMVSALFVQSDGCYFGLDNVDPWDEQRDARKYDGHNPVIAHPPCKLWCKMTAINYKRWGGEHNRPGNDGGCFKSAILSVIRCGGVCEHPARSLAYDAYGLTKPKTGMKGWERVGNAWICEVWQSAYGHRANKATWLYYVGRKPFDLRWDRPVGTHQVGFYDKRGKMKNKPTLSKKEASSTPIEFRDELIKLAEWSLCGHTLEEKGGSFGN